MTSTPLQPEIRKFIWPCQKLILILQQKGEKELYGAYFYFL